MKKTTFQENCFGNDFEQQSHLSKRHKADYTENKKGVERGGPKRVGRLRLTNG